jgi:ubiquinone/menaquinone biosynthesis C-methylase UbiE
MRNRQRFGFLENARLYRLVQVVTAPGAARAIPAEILEERSGRSMPRHLVDVGCGPASLLQPLGLRPVGVDASFSYAQAFRRSGGAVVVASCDTLPFRDGVFDEAWSLGLFHHLPDEMASETVLELTRVTRAGGWTTVFDSVLPAPTTRKLLAFVLRKMDRGRHVRSETEIRTLFPASRRWSVRRFQYAATGLEGALCSRENVARRQDGADLE